MTEEDDCKHYWREAYPYGPVHCANCGLEQGSSEQAALIAKLQMQLANMQSRLTYQHEAYYTGHGAGEKSRDADYHYFLADVLDLPDPEGDETPMDVIRVLVETVRAAMLEWDDGRYDAQPAADGALIEVMAKLAALVGHKPETDEVVSDNDE